MSFTTNGNMHRHSRIHTKEENLKSLGAHFQRRAGKSAWRQRVSNFLNQQKLNNPSPSPQDILKNLPNHSQHSVFGAPPQDLMSQISPVAGMKRQLSGTDIAADWPMTFKRANLESSSSDGESSRSLSPRKPIAGSSFPVKLESEEDNKTTEVRKKTVKSFLFFINGA